MRIPVAGRFCVALALHFILCAQPRTASAQDPGPDAFGYTAADVPFVFEDLSGTGTRVLARTSDEVATAPLGFTFTFYGVDYTAVSWSTNGLITLAGTNPDAENVSFAAAAPAGDHPSIAVLWDDWQFEQPGADATYFEVRGDEGSRRFMVQWNLVFESPFSPSNVIFQAALFEGSNDILLSFPDVDTATAAGFGGSATVGIRDAGGQLSGRNLEWSFDSGVINTRQSIRFLAPSDTTPPAVSITSPSDGAVVGSANLLVAVAVTDESPTSVSSNPAGIAASLPAGGGALSGMIALVEGPNTIVLAATDASGNASGASITVVRDMTIPTISVLSPGSGSVLGDTPASFAVAVRDFSATTVSIGSTRVQLPAGGGSASALVDLVEGQNTVNVTAIDSVGNVATAAVAVVLDTSAPLVTIDSPLDGASFGAGESQVPFVVTVNDGTPTQVNSVPAGIAASLPAGGGVAVGAILLAEGSNRIAVTAVDSTGRAGTASIVLLLDTTPPAVALDSPSAGMSLRGEVELAASASDAGSGVARLDLLVDGRAVASFTTPPFETILETSLFADGAHTLTAAALDREGNAASSLVRVQFDNTPPAVAFSAPLAGVTAKGTIELSVQASDAQSGIVLVQVLAGGSPPSVDPSRSFLPAVRSAQLDGEEDSTRRPDGFLSLTALAVDAAGNESIASVTVQVDNTPPGAVTISPRSGSVVSGVITITAEAPELNGGTLEIFVAGARRASSSSSPLALVLDTTGIPDGILVIRAVARDAAGNESSAVSNLTVDNLAVEMRLTPTVLNLKPRRCGHDGWRDGHQLVVAYLEGDGLDRLLPVRKHGVELRVPGGSPVRALSALRERSCKNSRERARDRLHVKFDRDALVSSIRAGIASGDIDPHAEIAVSLYADGAHVATAYIRVVSR